MSAATVALIVAILQALISAVGQLPEVIAAGETAIGLLQTQSDPTPEQEASIRAALDAANKALQGS